MNLLFSDEKIREKLGKTIFLAGPTSRKNVFEKSWRKEAVGIVEKIGFNGTICLPEFKEARPFSDEDDWDTQTDWEWKLLDNADCIVFWIPRELPDMPGFTTNLEFGCYITKCPEKVVLGYPPFAEKMQWIDKKYRISTGRIPNDNLYDTIKEAIEIANK